MSLYKGNNLISGHQVLYSTTGNNTDGAMTQNATTSELNNKANTNLTNLVSTSSTNFDGQWVISNLTLANSVAVSSSNVTYSLASYLPNDGYNYEVLLAGNCFTDAVSGHFSRIIVLSDLVGDYVNMMQVRTRTASTVDAAGNCIIPVGVGRTITFVGSTSSNFGGTYTLTARAYRRIGTNS